MKDWEDRIHGDISPLSEGETMKKLLLINPVGRKSGYLMSRFTTFAPLGLGYIAAVTPATWDVKIIDENFDSFEYENADLVGITAFTSSINRAYAIANRYRVNGTKVVLGGIHASMFPDEAVQYVDTVVKGEAENIWPVIIKDFENNTLKKIYDGPRLNMEDHPITPRRDLFHPNYFWQSVQTSRGCPFDCHFCSVSKYLGREFRQRKPSAVLKELEEIEGDHIAFVDDNLIGYQQTSRSRAQDIFSGMIDLNLNKRWWMQTSMNAAEDQKTLELAADAGCMFAFIGFETINQSALKNMKKGINLKIGVEKYRKVVDTFHKHGIGVMGAFIIGNDHESMLYYKKLADFIIKSTIDIIQISVLTPLPGTKLMHDLQEQNRIIYKDFPEDWDKYRFSYLVHRPEEIDPETVYTGDNYIKNRLYSFPAYHRRILRTAINLKSKTKFITAFMLNKALKKSWKNSHYYKKFVPKACD